MGFAMVGRMGQETSSGRDGRRIGGTGLSKSCLTLVPRGHAPFLGNRIELGRLDPSNNSALAPYQTDSSFRSLYVETGCALSHKL